MTPPAVLDPPKNATRSTESAAVEFASVLVHDLSDAEADEVSWLGSGLWPEGIDYEKWGKVAKPSPRSAFADRLDIVDLLGD